MCLSMPASARAVDLSLPKQQRYIFGGHRLGEIEALRRSTPPRFQQIELLFGFDTLRDHIDSQEARQADGGLDDRRVSRVRHKINDKLLRQFNPIDRKATQIGQGRIASSEIVDGDLDAPLP